MNRVLRVEATDERITYVGPWTRLPDNSMTMSSEGCQFFWMFRGTRITMYGDASGFLTFGLDGNLTRPILYNTTSNRVKPMYYSDDMQDGDHQLLGQSVQAPFFQLFYFEIENSSGGGFDLLSSGPTAQNVPAQALIMDDASPEIIHYKESAWTRDTDSIMDYKGGVSISWTKGSSLSYSFDGVAIWYYARSCPHCGFFTISIDAMTPRRMNASGDWNLNQQMIWSNDSLGSGKHTVTLTHDDDRGLMLSLDFFRVLPGELPTDLPPAPSTNQSLTNRVPLAIGLALGLLALVVGVFGGVYYLYLRRGKTPTRLDVQFVFPYTIPSMREVSQHSGIPPDGKCPPQPAQLSSAPMDTGDPVISSGGSVLGPPPSYVTSIYDRRVGVAPHHNDEHLL